MKINLSRNDQIKLEKLLETKEINMAIADMLMNFFGYDLSKEKLDNKEDLKELFMRANEIDESDIESVEIIDKYLCKNFKVLNEDIFTTNDYFNKVRPQLVNNSQYSLCLDHFTKNQTFSYDDVEIDENDYFAEIYNIGCFSKKVSFLAISHKKEIWMNISPNEINTMKEAVNTASGDVLVYGLGLGYFPYMISLKEDVKSITIIEKDPQIINIFKNNILKFYKFRDKIKIIEADAFDFIKSNKNHFDYVFVDLWHNPEDGLPIYLEFKKYEDSSSKYFYWIEKSIKAMHRRCLLTVVQESLEGYGDEQYKKAETFADQVINDFYFKTKNIEVTTYEQLLNLIKV